jgi:hypothetical protein
MTALHPLLSSASLFAPLLSFVLSRFLSSSFLLLLGGDGELLGHALGGVKLVERDAQHSPAEVDRDLVLVHSQGQADAALCCCRSGNWVRVGVRVRVRVGVRVKVRMRKGEREKGFDWQIEQTECHVLF